MRLATPILRKPKIFGIVNVTPDSFSGDGLLNNRNYVTSAVAQAQAMVGDGADGLDIGGESSRPGSTPVTAAEEIRRTAPVIAAIRAVCGPDLPISIDTVKVEVAEAAFAVGATILNDISALRHDPGMAALVARFGCPVILMDNRAETFTRHDKIGGMFDGQDHPDITAAVIGHLQERIDAAIASGIARDNIILDPGLGFGKTPEQNLTLVRELPRLNALGFPVMVGASRKSFIGQVLNQPVGDRLAGDAALNTVATILGAAYLRVHDVQFTMQATTMATALRAE